VCVCVFFPFFCFPNFLFVVVDDNKIIYAVAGLRLDFASKT